MDTVGLIQNPLALAHYRFGTVQTSGPLSVIPIFGPDRQGEFVGPRSGLKLSQVKGYGNLELNNPAARGVAIVPLHMGYIQENAQNHCLCRSGFIAAGQKVMFDDACCVQQAQGGYLTEREQWFFVLPLALREAAFQRRRIQNYSKLWPSIRELCQQFHLEDRGHLEQIISRKRAYLNQYQSRFELLDGQIGAAFFLNHRLVGVEIAPTADYFREVWMGLICFCYGTSAMYLEQHTGWELTPKPLEGTSVAALKEALFERRTLDRQQLLEELQILQKEEFRLMEEERFLDLELHSVDGKLFAGQVVVQKGEMTYLSLFGRQAYLNSVN